MRDKHEMFIITFPIPTPANIDASFIWATNIRFITSCIIDMNWPKTVGTNILRKSYNIPQGCLQVPYRIGKGAICTVKGAPMGFLDGNLDDS